MQHSSESSIYQSAQDIMEPTENVPDDASQIIGNLQQPEEEQQQEDANFEDQEQEESELEQEQELDGDEDEALKESEALSPKMNKSNIFLAAMPSTDSLASVLKESPEKFILDQSQPVVPGIGDLKELSNEHVADSQKVGEEQELLKSALQDMKLYDNKSPTAILDNNKQISGSSSSLGPGRIRLYADEDPSSPQWKNHSKHFFILSSAGKPIYSRYGDENKLSPLMGVIQTIISHYLSTDDSLRLINAGSHKMVFLVRGDLYFVLVARSQRKGCGDSESSLRDELLWLYHQILSIISATQLQRIFEKQSGFDLRRLLGGTEPFLDHLCETVGHRPGYILGAIHSLKMDSSIRQAVGSALLQAKSYSKQGLLYAMLIVKESLITLLRPKRHSFHPSDLHLIFNMVNSSTSFKTAPESWLPICLPKFNDKGFLHAYISYITPNYPAPASDLCLVLINSTRDAFFQMSECKKLIVDHLTTSGALFLLQDAIRNSGYTVGDIGVSGIRHFLFKSKTNIQFTAPLVTSAPYSTSEPEEKRLYKLYQRLRAKIYSRSLPLKLCFYATDREAVFAWSTASFEVYACFAPNVSKNTATHAVNSLLKWLKKEEDRLFVMNAPTFST